MERAIFKRSSTTFFISALAIPRPLRQDIFDLYSFVRIADNYVDQLPSDEKGFYGLRNLWRDAHRSSNFDTDKNHNDSVDERVVKNILHLSRKHDLNRRWIETFLDTMQSDIEQKEYKTLEDTLRYMYGSAEVIGLMMAKIMGLPKAALPAAQIQGRAMQYINFIRDIEEDNLLKRQYFPSDDLKRFGLRDLKYKTAADQPDDFWKFIHFQVERYREWQTEAYKGHRFVPPGPRVALKSAAQMYDWTARQIEKDPFVVFRRKVKPGRWRVAGSILSNSIT